MFFQVSCVTYRLLFVTLQKEVLRLILFHLSLSGEMLLAQPFMKSILMFILLGVLAWSSSSWLGGTYRAAEVGRIQSTSALEETMQVQRSIQNVVDTYQYLKELESYEQNENSYKKFLASFIEKRTSPLRGVRQKNLAVGNPEKFGGTGQNAFNIVYGLDDKPYFNIRDKSGEWWFDSSGLPKGLSFSKTDDTLSSSGKEGTTTYLFDILLNGNRVNVEASWITSKANIPRSPQEMLLRAAPWGIVILLALVVIMINIASQAADSEKKAYKDPLTGAFNKAWLSHWKKTAGQGEGVLLIDCNDFKRVNDVFGHAEGDKALQILTRIVHRTLRQEDIFFRTGGDEFVAVLRSVYDNSTMKRVARRIKRQVSKDSRDLRSGPLSLSIGLALIDGDGEIAASKALEKADGNMYRYKRFCKRIKKQGSFREEICP